MKVTLAVHITLEINISSILRRKELCIDLVDQLAEEGIERTQSKYFSSG